MRALSLRDRRDGGRHGVAATAAGPVQRLDETRLAHRLDQVVDCRCLERRQRVLIVGGAEDHRGMLLKPGEMPGSLQAIHHRHGDVQQYHVRADRAGHFHRIAAVAGFAGDHAARHVSEHRHQALARQRLVVDDQHTQGSGRSIRHR